MTRFISRNATCHWRIGRGVSITLAGFELKQVPGQRSQLMQSLAWNLVLPECLHDLQQYPLLCSEFSEEWPIEMAKNSHSSADIAYLHWHPLFLVQCHILFPVLLHLSSARRWRSYTSATTDSCLCSWNTAVQAFMVMTFSVWKCVTVMRTCMGMHFSTWLIHRRLGPLSLLHQGLCWPFCKCLKSTLLHSLF